MKKLGIALGLTLLASGCATIMSPEQQSINVTTSNSQNIEVTVDDKTVTAPGMVTILRDGKDKVVKTSGEGCESSTVIKKSVSPLFFGNIILGGLPGSTTDGATGKMWNYADDVEVKCAG